MNENDIVIQKIYEARACGGSLAIKAHIIQNKRGVDVTLTIPYELVPTLSVIKKNWNEIRRAQIEVDELETKIVGVKRRIVELNSAMSW